MPRIHQNRRGATTVEFAVTLPIFFLVLFTSLDFMRANNLLHTAQNAAYEGARLGICPGVSAGQIEAETRRILGVLGTVNSDVTVTPAAIAVSTNQVTVDVAIPMNTNGLLSPFFFKDRTMRASMTMRRELFDQTNTP